MEVVRRKCVYREWLFSELKGGITRNTAFRPRTITILFVSYHLLSFLLHSYSLSSSQCYTIHYSSPLPYPPNPTPLYPQNLPLRLLPLPSNFPYCLSFLIPCCRAAYSYSPPNTPVCRFLVDTHPATDHKEMSYTKKAINLLSTKLYLSDSKTQFVPCSKHSLPRL